MTLFIENCPSLYKIDHFWPKIDLRWPKIIKSGLNRYYLGVFMLSVLLFSYFGSWAVAVFAFKYF